jgi:ornithine cyclodeaminase/alanine dehydrogenase-like protein (mu-crystallin family)
MVIMRRSGRGGTRSLTAPAVGNRVGDGQPLGAETVEAATSSFVATAAQTPVLRSNWVARGAHVCAAGACRPTHVAGELGELAAGRVSGRQGERQVTLSNHSHLAFSRATARGLGQEIEV